MAAARAAYAERRRVVSRVLVDNGVAVTGTDGINLWMAVDDERAAVVALAAQGIGVAPGTPFLVRPDGDHLRVTVGAALARARPRTGGAATRRRRAHATPRDRRSRAARR